MAYGMGHSFARPPRVFGARVIWHVETCIPSRAGLTSEQEREEFVSACEKLDMPVPENGESMSICVRGKKKYMLSRDHLQCRILLQSHRICD